MTLSAEERLSLPLGRRTNIYILPPPYLAYAGLVVGTLCIMLIHSNTCMWRGILGSSCYGRRELSHADRVKRENRYSLSHCGNAFNHTALKAFHSFQKMQQKVIRNDGRNVTNENLHEWRSSSTYEDAMEALSSLITRKRRGGNTNTDAKYSKLERMAMYLQILGIEEQIADLRIIHVAGTKGKGSTCTFCEAILRESGFKTGLFTSPHLIDVRERFRLNGLEISEGKFLLYFWDCWNQLKVDVAIVEVGLGGKMDSTNVIQDPVVCGITSLGFDHTEILGDTLEKIALHKAGIFKPRVPAFTVPQLPEAMDALKKRAQELEVSLQVVAPITYKRLNGGKLSLSGDHQLVNAGLAVSLCKSWLNTTRSWENLFQNDIADDSLPDAFLRGLSTAHLSGRAQIVHDSSLGLSNQMGRNESCSGELIFYLDGAHSPESMDACAKWFSNVVKEKIHRPVSSFSNHGNMEEAYNNGRFQQLKEKEESNTIIKRILLFNCMEVRDPEIILPRLVDICASSGSDLSKAIFVPSMSTYSKVTSGASDIPLNFPSRDLAWQFNLQKVWERIIHGRDIRLSTSVKMECAETLPPTEFLYDDISHCNPANGKFSCSTVFPSLPSAISWLRNSARDNPSLRLQVLVTGSLHLVGDVLKLLRR